MLSSDSYLSEKMTAPLLSPGECPPQTLPKHSALGKPFPVHLRAESVSGFSAPPGDEELSLFMINIQDALPGSENQASLPRFILGGGHLELGGWVWPPSGRASLEEDLEIKP